MIDSVRKTILNTLQIQKIACGGYFIPNTTGSLDSLASNSRTKGALSIDAMVGTVQKHTRSLQSKKSNCILENVSLSYEISRFFLNLTSKLFTLNFSKIKLFLNFKF